MHDTSINQLLQEILVSAGMKECKSDTYGTVYSLSNDGSGQYLLIYLLSDGELPTIFIDRQREIFSKLCHDMNVSDFDKNVSALICVEESETVKPIPEREILITEENQYYFKKYVLAYNKENVKKLYAEAQGNDILQYIMKICFDSKRFDKFVEKKDATYQFILKLLVKLPMIRVDLPSIDEPIMLADLIENKVKDESIEVLRTAICEVNQEKFVKQIADWGVGGKSFDKQVQELDDILGLFSEIEGEEQSR